MKNQTPIRIREDSWLALIAAKLLKARSVAIVFGNTIYLHNTSRSDFLSNKRWVLHELTHIQQYKRYGFVSFICLYLIESMRKGYHNNRFEVEARMAEKNSPSEVLKDFT